MSQSELKRNVEIDKDYQIEKTIKLYLIYWAHAFESESERIC